MKKMIALFTFILSVTALALPPSGYQVSSNGNAQSQCIKLYEGPGGRDTHIVATSSCTPGSAGYDKFGSTKGCLAEFAKACRAGRLRGLRSVRSIKAREKLKKEDIRKLPAKRLLTRPNVRVNGFR